MTFKVQTGGLRKIPVVNSFTRWDSDCTEFLASLYLFILQKYNSSVFVNC